MFSGRRDYDLEGLSVADLLLRDDLDDEPVEAFESLLLHVKDGREPEHVALVASRILALHPTHRAALASLLRAKTLLGAPREVEARLCDALIAEPNSISLRELLVEMYEALGDREAADAMRREISDAQRWRGNEPTTLLTLPGEDPESLPSIPILAPSDPVPAAAGGLFDPEAEDPPSCPSLLLVEVADSATPPSLILTEEVRDPQTKAGLR